MHEKDCIEDMDVIWDSEQCEIQAEEQIDFDSYLQSLKLNDELSRVMRLSKRHWLTDPILVKNEITGLHDYIREQSYYLKIDLKQRAKGVIKSIYARVKSIL